MTSAVKAMRQNYEDSNRLAAEIIASDPANYPTHSLMAQWAVAVLARLEREKQASIGPLFAFARRAA
jgi:hypothetical protein